MFSMTPELPTAEQALPGRSVEMPVTNQHFVTGQPIQAPFAEGLESVVIAMGCFWGAERRFWQQPGVVTTAVGYAGGHTPNPTYEEACSGLTGHTEAVLVVFDPQVTSLEKLLAVFWESHDPTQGMRQGNDRGSQYRSAIYCHDEGQLARPQHLLSLFKLSWLSWALLRSPVKLCWRRIFIMPRNIISSIWLRILRATVGFVVLVLVVADLVCLGVWCWFEPVSTIGVGPMRTVIFSVAELAGAQTGPHSI